MAMPPRSLKAFLAAARSVLAAPPAARPRPLTFVVGNESADLDSLCSSILLAYLRSHKAPWTLHIPLANLERDDLRLRPELQEVLCNPQTNSATGAASAEEDSGISLDELTTLSELPADLVAADTRWLLVDHNALTGELGRQFGPRAVGCIDHHVDEKVIPVPDTDQEDAPPRIIETCGSCASLVVRATAATWRELAEQQPDPATDRLLAQLALAPILVDTSGLRSESKTTDVDREAVELAESFLPHRAASIYDRDTFFADLSVRKDDISSFSYRDALRKDYKQWHEKTQGGAGPELALGMATIVQGFGYMEKHIGDRAALLDALRAFAAEKQVDLVAIMSIRHDETVPFGRELLLWALSDTAVAAAQVFAEKNTERLGLETWEDGVLDDTTTPGQWRRCWHQKGHQFSRKQLAPYLREAMRSV